MDSYAKHLLQIAAMIGAVMLSTALVSGGNGAQEEPAPTREQSAAIRVEPAAFAEESAAQTTQEEGYYVALVAEPGETVTLTDGAGTVLQTAAADGDGDLWLGPVAPGSYRVQQGTKGGEFVLLETAAVEAVSGTLWSDGELLHLTQTQTVCLRISLTVDRAQTGRVHTAQLVAENGEAFERSFYAARSGAYALQFYGVPEGVYELWQDGQMLRTICVSARNP